MLEARKHSSNGHWKLILITRQLSLLVAANLVNCSSNIAIFIVIFIVFLIVVFIVTFIAAICH